MEVQYGNKKARYAINNKALNWYRLKYPLMVSVGFLIAFDWIKGWDGPTVGGH